MSESTDHLFHAFAEIISKRALLDQEHIPKLLNFALQAGVQDHDTLRQWVANTKKLTHGLRQELLDVLRTPRQRRFGAFTVVGRLAEGGMGDVWLATDDTGTLAVIKTLLPELYSDGEFVRRFQREAHITAGFTSPYLVRCLDVGTSSEQQESLYITLEYVSGGDLHNLICARHRLSEVEVLRIGRQVALALVEAEELQLVHRDIKPENILITAKGDSKLVDFGLARTTNADRTVLTLAGSTLGTPDYMSPEQIYGEQDLDIRSDIYALGCVLFFCLAGHPPYEGDSIDIMKNHIDGPIPDIRKINREVSKHTRAIIDRCMAKDRKQRFQCANDLAEACGAAMERQGTKRYDTTMRGIKLSEILPPPQFASDSFMDLAEVDLAVTRRQPAPTPQGSNGEATHWLLLHDPSSGLTIHCIGKQHLLIGKLRAPPVDICLRYYPKERYADFNNRISRQHAELRTIDHGSGYAIVDLASTNGLIINGTRIPAHTPWEIPTGATTRLQIPKSIALSLRLIGGMNPCGVWLSRAENHPQVSYVMANGPFSVGDSSCDVVVGGNGISPCEIEPTARGWQWRQGTGAWQALNPGTTIPMGGMTLHARWGNHDDFA